MSEMKVAASVDMNGPVMKRTRTLKEDIAEEDSVTHDHLKNIFSNCAESAGSLLESVGADRGRSIAVIDKLNEALAIAEQAIKLSRLDANSKK